MALFTRPSTKDEDSTSPRPPKRRAPKGDRSKAKKKGKPAPMVQDIQVSPFFADHTRAGLANRFNELRARRADTVIVTVCLGVALLVSLGVNAYQASRSHIEPYMVVVDGSQGFLLSHGPLEPMDSIEEIYIQREIREILTGLRNVTSDAPSTVAQFTQSYDRVVNGSAGDAFLRDYFLRPGNLPEDVINQNGQRTVVEFTGPTPIAGTKTWTVQWIERTAIGGRGVTEDLYRGSVTVNVVPVEDLETAQQNPLGVWIDGAQWEKVSSKYLDLEQLGDVSPLDLLYPDPNQPLNSSAFDAAPSAQPAPSAPAASPATPATPASAPAATGAE